MRLPFGSFYGVPDVRCRAGAFEVAVLDADPHRAVEQHTHEDAHFVLVLDGLYVSTARGAAAVSAEPVLIYNPPGTTHRDRFTARQGRVTGRFLTVSVSAVSLEEAGVDRHRVPQATVLGASGALECAHQMTRAVRSAGGFLEAGGYELLAAISAAPTAEHREPAWLGRAREQMLDDPSQPVSIAALAREADVHPVHFSRAFRKFHGLGPAAYALRHRTEHALALLRHTERPIAEIAVATGFVDQSHLSRVVKRGTGFPPGAFRRATRTRPCRPAMRP